MFGTIRWSELLLKGTFEEGIFTTVNTNSFCVSVWYMYIQHYLFSVFFIIKINSALIISTVVLGPKFFINVLSKHQRIIVTLFMFLEYPLCRNHLITFQHKALFICFVSESSYLLAPERNLHIKPFNLVGFYRKPIPTNSLSELQLMLTVQVLSYICLLTVSLKFIKILTFYLICTTSNLGGGGQFFDIISIFWISHHFNNLIKLSIHRVALWIWYLVFKCFIVSLLFSLL